MSAKSYKKKHSTKTSIDIFFEKRPYASILLSGLLSAAGLLIIYACIGIFPFGDKSVANVDMVHQYIPFYASLKNAVFGGHGLSYSQSLGMGGSYWGLIGYYLTSPFAALSLLVPDESLADYMAIQELFRIALTGCSFACFFSRRFRRNDLSVPLFSLCYAMSSFMLLHLCTVVWGGCLMLLPLIVWGLEELLRGKKPWLYVLCITLAGISNYYFALIIGIYLVLYAAAFMFSENLFDNLSLALRRAGMFAACSLLGAGGAAAILLPSAMLLGETGNSSEKAASGFFALNPVLLLRQMLFHPDCRIIADDSRPLIYCSVFAAMCLPLFFISRKIPSRVKIAFGMLSGILTLSLAVNALNFLWHGMHIPNQLPYRFSFLIVFTALIMSGYALQYFRDFSPNTFNAVLSGMIAVTAAAYFACGRDMTMLAVTLIMSICYTVIALLIDGKKITVSASSALALGLVFAELTACGVLAWRDLEDESGYIPRSTYISHCSLLKAAAERISVSDSDIFRTGMLNEISYNNNAFSGLGGLSCFSSTNNGGLMKMLNASGYDADGRVLYYYKSFSPLMDSVLNMKYIVYNHDVGEPPYLKRLPEDGGCFIYRNELALPRAFAVSDSLRGWNVSFENPFDVQNNFLQMAVSDSDLTVYEKIPLVPDETYSSGVKYSDGIITFSPAGGQLALNAVSRSRKHLYAYIDLSGASSIQIAVGERLYTISDKDNYVTDLGWWEKGERFTVAATAEKTVRGRVYAALLDESALENGISRLSRSPAVFTEYTETSVSCRIDAESGEMLFTSIPYEKGWRVTVNGRPVKPCAIGGGLIGVPLGKGKNTVELQFTVRGRTAGVIISIVSTALAVMLLFGSNFFKKIRRT